jgi:hypothetical protein
MWYADYPQSKFHFFNDNTEWLQMDKLGHAGTAYYLSRFSYESFRWTGLDKRRSAIYGSAAGFTFLSLIEVFDGFSAQWGASPGDILANTCGTALFLGQQLMWEEQKVLLKFSWSPSKYASYRPNALGAGVHEQLLKDYNAQTYWLSVNVRSTLGEWTHAPHWLNLALGYSAEGLLGGKTNPSTDSFGRPLPDFNRSRQYFLSLDIDLTRIKTRNKALTFLLHAFGWIKIPFPALEYQKGKGIKGRALYF